MGALMGGASPMGGMPSITSSSSAETGQQSQSGNFSGGGIDFGTDGNNQLMIVAAVAIGLLLVMKSK
jgi:hypothetical protein